MYTTNKTRKYAALVITLIVLTVSGYAYWLHQQRYPSTDDAYIQANLINIAPEVSGKVLQVLVKDQADVKKNQLLFTIDQKPFQIALKKAQADLANTKQTIVAEQNAVAAATAELLQRQAQYVEAQKNYQRIMELVKQGFYAKAGGDHATRVLNVTKQAVNAANDQLNEAKAKLGKPGDQNAQLQAAQSALAQAELNLQYTTIYSPSDGQLAQLSIRPGQTVTAYQTLFSVIDDRTWWALANMKETNLQRVRIGQSAEIKIDMYPGHIFHGTVTSISPGSGNSFALLPAENATGNWVKVTQRFPVRIDIQSSQAQFPLRIGASCHVVIDTVHQR